MLTLFYNRDPLPAIGFLGKDGSGYTPKPSAASPTPLMSPNAMYAGQPLPYAYAPPATSAPAQPGYLSPTESRRALEDEKDKSGARQSLPSIHEALGNDNPLPYPAPTSAPPPPSGHAAPPTHLVGRTSTEGPAGPPNPFNGPASGPLMREPGFPHQNQLQAEASRSSLTSINTQESRNASLQSLSTGKSPTQSAKTGITSVSGSQNSSYDYSAPPSAGSVASPNGYNHFPPNYTFPQQPSGPSYPPAHYDNRPYMGAPRVEEVKGGFVGRPIPGQAHSDSVKRHLDIYDVETSLNEVWIFFLRVLFFAFFSTLASVVPTLKEKWGVCEIGTCRSPDHMVSRARVRGKLTCRLGTDCRDEHTNIGFFTTLRCPGTPHATVWTGPGFPSLADRGGGHSPYATSEPRCPGPDTHGRGEPGTGVSRADGSAEGVQVRRGRTHGHVPRRVQRHRWLCGSGLEKTAWSKFPLSVAHSHCPIPPPFAILPVYPGFEIPTC